MPTRFLAAVLVSACYTSTPAPQQVPPPAPPAQPPPPPAERPAQARVVQQNASGGVLTLDPTNRASYRMATSVMAAHCGPDNYAITAEGEEVVGQDRVVGGATRDVTEWRLHYTCHAAAP